MGKISLDGRKVLILAFWDDALQLITKLVAKLNYEMHRLMFSVLFFMLLFKTSTQGALKGSMREHYTLFVQYLLCFVYIASTRTQHCCR